VVGADARPAVWLSRPTRPPTRTAAPVVARAPVTPPSPPPSPPPAQLRIMPDGSGELKLGYVRFDVTAGAPKAMWEGVFAERAGDAADKSAVTATGRMAEVVSSGCLPVDSTWMVVPQVDRLLETARQQRGAKMLPTRYLPPKPGSAAAVTTAIVAGADAMSPANPYRSLVAYYQVKREEEEAQRKASKQAALPAAAGGGKGKVRIVEPAPSPPLPGEGGAAAGGGGGHDTEDEEMPAPPAAAPATAPAAAPAPKPIRPGGTVVGKSALKRKAGE
jgi:hypothetical protein